MVPKAANFSTEEIHITPTTTILWNKERRWTARNRKQSGKTDRGRHSKTEVSVFFRNEKLTNSQTITIIGRTLGGNGWEEFKLGVVAV